MEGYSSLGGFAGGLSSGLETGMKLRDAITQRKAREAVARTMAGQQQQPPPATGQPPMPGQPSQPAPGGGAPPPGSAGLMGGPRPMPIPGATPLPPGVGGAPVPMSERPGPPGPPPMSERPTGAPPMAGVGDQRMGPPGGAPPPTPASDAAPQNASDPSAQGFVPDTQKTMRTIIGEIAKANPGIKPAVLFEAASQQIAMMKGLEGDSRIYMQASIAQAKIQSHMEEALLKATNALDAATIKAEAAAEQARIAAEGRQQVAQLNKEGRIGAAEIGAGARVDAAKISADARKYAADTGYSGKRANEASRVYERTFNTVLKETGNTERARLAAEAKIDAAKIAMGQEPTPRGGGGAPRPAAPAAPAAAGGGAYRSLNDLIAAHKAGKVSAAEAQRIARAKGWAE